MEVQQKPTITLDGKEYVVDDLSEKARYCLQQIQVLNTEIREARFKIDRCEIALNGFGDILRAEVKEEGAE